MEAAHIVSAGIFGSGLTASGLRFKSHGVRKACGCVGSALDCSPSFDRSASDRTERICGTYDSQTVLRL